MFIIRSCVGRKNSVGKFRMTKEMEQIKNTYPLFLKTYTDINQLYYN